MKAHGLQNEIKNEIVSKTVHKIQKQQANKNDESDMVSDILGLVKLIGEVLEMVT